MKSHIDLIFGTKTFGNKYRIGIYLTTADALLTAILFSEYFFLSSSV